MDAPLRSTQPTRSDKVWKNQRKTHQFDHVFNDRSERLCWPSFEIMKTFFLRTVSHDDITNGQHHASLIDRLRSTVLQKRWGTLSYGQAYRLKRDKGDFPRQISQRFRIFCLVHGKSHTPRFENNREL